MKLATDYLPEWLWAKQESSLRDLTISDGLVVSAEIGRHIQSLPNLETLNILGGITRPALAMGFQDGLDYLSLVVGDYVVSWAFITYRGIIRLLPV